MKLTLPKQSPPKLISSATTPPVKTTSPWGITPLPADNATDHETEAMRRTMIQQFDQYVKLNKKIPPEILTYPEQNHTFVDHDRGSARTFATRPTRERGLRL